MPLLPKLSEASRCTFLPGISASSFRLLEVSLLVAKRGNGRIPYLSCFCRCWRWLRPNERFLPRDRPNWPATRRPTDAIMALFTYWTEPDFLLEVRINCTA